jgi:hypothetical protein
MVKADVKRTRRRDVAQAKRDSGGKKNACKRMLSSVQGRFEELDMDGRD